MGETSHSGIGEIERQALSILHPKGAQAILVTTVSGLPVLRVAREEYDRERIDLDRLSAWAAELANVTFSTAGEMHGGVLLRAELRFDDEAILLLRDDPFVMVVSWMPVAGKPLGGSREDGLRDLLQTLHEELN
jgi:predicted regulator of Ras-like GTPase activity (Roadblock/LC7/MglB family)